MKAKFFSAFALTGLLMAACSEAPKTEENTEATTDVAATEQTTYNANVEETDVLWSGEVAGVYGHNGYVNLKEGSVTLAGDKIVGGSFVVDMTGIYPTDSSYEYNEKSNPEKLAAHLSTDDFFNTAEYPTATFNITNVEGNNVTGDFTVRGNTHQETLVVENMNVEGEKVTFSGTLVFDRQKYNVSWEHFMEDMVLSDDIEIKVNVVATK